MNKLIKAISDAVSKYKQARVEAAVAAYAKATEAHMLRIAPMVVAIYKDVADTIVTKTYEDSTPLTEFLTAAQKLTDHYGPAVMASYTARITQVMKATGNIDKTPEMTALVQSIEDLTTDVNEQPAPARPFSVVAADGSITH